jgi:hypothetical protein
MAFPRQHLGPAADALTPSSELVGLPDRTVDLIPILERVFPLENPTAAQTYAEIQRAAGARDVINHILRLKRRGDSKNVPSGSP